VKKAAPKKAAKKKGRSQKGKARYTHTPFSRRIQRQPTFDEPTPHFDHDNDNGN
jgi:hypothetical protein